LEQRNGTGLDLGFTKNKWYIKSETSKFIKKKIKTKKIINLDKGFLDVFCLYRFIFFILFIIT